MIGVAIFGAFLVCLLTALSFCRIAKRADEDMDRGIKAWAGMTIPHEKRPGVIEPKGVENES